MQAKKRPQKRIYCYQCGAKRSTYRMFHSQLQASKALGMSQSNISRALSGHLLNSTYMGVVMCFSYEKEEGDALKRARRSDDYY